MAQDETPLYTLQYSLDDADFDRVYEIYLNTERREEKQIAVYVMIAIAVVVAVLNISFGVNLNFFIYGIIGIVAALSYVLIPTNKKFIKEYQTLYGSKHTLTVYENSVRIEERQEADAVVDEDDEFTEDYDSNCFEMNHIRVYETDKMFLIYKDRIHDYFEPVPKQLLSDAELADLRGYFTSHLGNKFKQLAQPAKEGTP